MPFADEVRRAIEAAPRQALPQVATVMWQAVLNGQINEAEAESLSALIEGKRALPAVPKAGPRRVGSRPHSPASVERRRSWASSGRLPPGIAARVTPGEAAVLVVVAVEVKRAGDFRWPYGKLAAVAGVSVSTAKRALRVARDIGWISITERRLSAWRSDTNIITIVCPTWMSWLARGGGVQTWPPMTMKRFSRTSQGGQDSVRDLRRGGVQGPRIRPRSGDGRMSGS